MQLKFCLLLTCLNSEQTLVMNMRNAQDTDLNRIVEIYNESIPTQLSTADLKPISIEDRREWFEARSSKRPILVYEDKGDVIAWVCFFDFNDKPAYHETAELSLYIDPKYQGRGLGSKILVQILPNLPDYGIHRLLAKIFSHNKASLALFFKFGFEEWGVLPGVCNMNGVYRDVSILGLKVSK